jgi:hypothetical protein
MCGEMAGIRFLLCCYWEWDLKSSVWVPCTSRDQESHSVHKLPGGEIGGADRSQMDTVGR